MLLSIPNFSLQDNTCLVNALFYSLVTRGVSNIVIYLFTGVKKHIYELARKSYFAVSE